MIITMLPDMSLRAKAALPADDCSSFEELCKAVSDNKTDLRITKDIVFTDTITIPEGKTININLKDDITLTASSNSLFFDVMGRLTLTGVWDTKDNLEIDCCNNAQLARVNEGSLTMISIDVANCASAEEGAAIYGNGSKINISSSNFTNCITDKDGGAIYGKNSTIYVEDTQFKNCTAGNNGGAIYGDQSKIEVSGTGTRFDNCTAYKDGGAIYGSGSEITGSGNDFYACQAGEDGGAIYCSNSDIIIN